MRRKKKIPEKDGFTIDQYVDTISEVAIECDRLLRNKEFFKEGNMNLYLAHLKTEFKEEIAKMIFELRQKQCLTCKRR